MIAATRERPARRYGVADAVELIKIRTLAEAGVPLARIRDLQATRQRLDRLADGTHQPLPAEVSDHLSQLTRLGFTRRWVTLQHDLWLLGMLTSHGA